MIADNGFSEKRREARVAGNIPIKISSDSGDFVTETVNISKAGTYCKVNQYVEPMTKLKISFLIPGIKGLGSPGKKVSCDGVVVRTEQIPEEDAYNLAIFFNDLNKRNAELIGDYVSMKLDEA